MPHRLSPQELGSLAKKLAKTSDPKEAGRLKERLTRGFYGICFPDSSPRASRSPKQSTKALIPPGRDQGL